jgi:hypothetical protein
MPEKKTGILRYAHTLEQIQEQYHLIPKHEAKELVLDAVKAVLNTEVELETYEDVTEMILSVLNVVEEKLER